MDGTHKLPVTGKQFIVRCHLKYVPGEDASVKMADGAGLIRNKRVSQLQVKVTSPRESMGQSL